MPHKNPHSPLSLLISSTSTPHIPRVISILFAFYSSWHQIVRRLSILLTLIPFRISESKKLTSTKLFTQFFSMRTLARSWSSILTVRRYELMLPPDFSFSVCAFSAFFTHDSAFNGRSRKPVLMGLNFLEHLCMRSYIFALCKICREWLFSWSWL